MKSQNIILEVVPPYSREQYEKSVIAPLYSSDNTDHVLKTKVPPPIHPKPVIKAIDLSGMDVMEPGVPIVLHSPKSPNIPRVSRKPPSPSLSPLMGFGSKKNSKKIRIDLKKGKWLNYYQVYECT